MFPSVADGQKVEVLASWQFQPVYSVSQGYPLRACYESLSGSYQSVDDLALADSQILKQGSRFLRLVVTPDRTNLPTI
jgi:hypothetical protein